MTTFEQIRSVVAGMLEIDENTIEKETELDSLIPEDKMIAVYTALEEEFDVQIDGELIKMCKNMWELTILIAGIVNATDGIDVNDDDNDEDEDLPGEI